MRHILERAKTKFARMQGALQTLVEAESPSSDPTALQTCAGILAEIGANVMGKPAHQHVINGTPHLEWPAEREGYVALIGHYDTVWPVGTLAEMPFRVDGEWCFGPGVLDMKCGLIQALAAVALAGPHRVALLFTGDEEVGSPTSRQLVEALARRARAVFVLEPAHDGALKTARKGCATYRISISGREAHAGLNPEQGVNATVALADTIKAVEALSDPANGITITPTSASSGTSTNTVPGSAHLHVDVRAWTLAELERMDRRLRNLTATARGASLVIERGPLRPPLEAKHSRKLFEFAQDVACELGIEALQSSAVGGGSDGGFCGALGTPTLDGLGAVGDGAHTHAERVHLPAIAPRIALVATLLELIRRSI